MNEDPRKSEDFEPTIRIDIDAAETSGPAEEPSGSAETPQSSGEDTSTRKVGKANDQSMTGRFLRHITGIFRRHDGAQAPTLLKPKAAKVSLEPSEKEAFPDLDAFYERSEEIGSGGQARLFRGFDRHLRRMAAVKSLREEHGQNKELREKFIAEAMITAQLDHPAIVPVYSIHRDKHNNLHLAMKLIHGRPFQSYLADLVRHYERDGFSAGEEQRSLNYRLEVFLSICDALEYAHNRNIMHCDLKPENIMIGEYHEAYLMDWGLARRIDDPEYDPDSWQSPTYITGTPRFLSPEALKGEHCDQRADIYAMGLILYEVVTLQFAYDGSDHQATLNRIRRGEMRPVTHRFGAPIPVDLRKIILKAAAWDREKRYQTMEEFSTDLRRFIRGEEVSANPDGLIGKLGRFGYRHRRLMFITTLVMVALGAVAVAYSIYERYNQEQIRHHQQQTLSRALGYAMGASRSLDRQITKMENGLRSVTAEALLLLNAELTVHGDPPVYSLTDLHDPQKRPKSLAYSPGFGFVVDMGNIACHVAPGAKPQKIGDRMRRLTLLTPMLLRTIVESSNESVLSEENLPILRERALKEGVPLVSLYFGFDDGLFVTYPGELGIDHNGTYDHRKRWWYTLRTRTDRSSSLKWHTPYLSVNGKLVFSCTLPMIDTKGKRHGIAAADISLPRMLAELGEEGNKGKALLAKSLVDRDGNIVLDLGKDFMRDAKEYYAVENGGLKLIPYPEQQLFKQIRERRVGYILREEKGKRVAYVFSGMFSVPWYYIEKLDLDELLKSGVSLDSHLRKADGRRRPAKGAGLE